MINKSSRILAILFIAFFAVNIILPSIVLLNFNVNQDYISKNLCVEKDIEESTCEGNCQLQKSLKVIEKGNSNQNEIQFNIESHISILFVPVVDLYDNEFVVEKKSYSDAENKNPLSGFYDIPFLPPILL